MATSVTQYGITWTFSADLPVGQFANGDYYVVAPSGVSIVDIYPLPVIQADGRSVNGAMVNPVAGQGAKQGYDSFANNYLASANAGLPNGSPIGAGNPLVLAAGSSLVSTISLPSKTSTSTGSDGGTYAITGTNKPKLAYAAVLTVLASAPPAGSFRPPMNGSSKTILANESGLDYSKLLRLTKPAAITADAAQAALKVQRPYLECTTTWNGTEQKAIYNQKTYGRDLAADLNDCAMQLQYDYSDAQKRDLLVGFIQVGIDFYGAWLSGGKWVPDGGHNYGRKLPIVFAAYMLGNSAMANAAATGVFQEDGQTFYIGPSDIARTNNAVALPAISSVTPNSDGTCTIVFVSSHGIPASKDHVVRLSSTVAEWHNLHSYSLKNSGVLNSTTLKLKTPGFSFASLSVPAGGSITAAYFPNSQWIPDSRAAALPFPADYNGYPEWGVRHSYQPYADNFNWAAMYRGTHSSMPKAALVCRLLGITALWAWPAFFDYCDRLVEKDGASTEWKAFRSLGGALWVPPTNLIAPTIEAHPSPVRGQIGQLAIFTVTAAGTAPLSYQWQRNGTNISGATNQVYSLVAAQADDGAQFSCTVTNAAGTVTSTPATLTVQAAPPTDPGDLSSLPREWQRRRVVV